MLTYKHLWAKTTSANRWHTLICHSLDVAATAEVLWEHLPSCSQAVPSKSFGCDMIAKQLCVFLAATHDVGKANRYFQSKNRQQYDRICTLYNEMPPFPPNEIKRHGHATGAYLKPWIIEHWNWENWTSESVALAVGGHHGTFFSNTKKTTLTIDEKPWSDIGRNMLDALSNLLLDRFETSPEPDPLNPFLGWLSGFVSVADWLGSHESMTVWESENCPIAEYHQNALSRARRLFEDLKWEAPPKTRQLTVSELLPPNCTPNSLQQLAETISSDFTFAIVEAPTGEGKTEAAFALAEPTRGMGSGIYFALPTMATANGLHKRVQRYLQKATKNDDLEARMLHSQAWLFREKVNIVSNPGKEGIEQTIQAYDWFTGSKRGLLAPYGVGTIDQVLIAALRAKHGFVRLFALAGKTVMIDEVHAYDVYMANLMDVLLGWLRALGCKVILLSATLPKPRRNDLLRAWGAKEQEVKSEYPAITWVTQKGTIKVQGFDVQARKPLGLNLVSYSNVEPNVKAASHILNAISVNGGLGALILNTVRDAQQAYDWMLKQELHGIHLELFHARFTAQDRNAIEKRVLERFGRDGARTESAILIATQVVEQSLDLDFDHMISALAPIDLLLQRAGRLHRHCRNTDGSLRENSTDERSDPILHILSPAIDAKGIPDIQDFVYSHDVLMRTLHRLQSNPQIFDSTEVSDAIDSVYGESERSKIRSVWEQKLDELEAKTYKKTVQEKHQAKNAAISNVENEDKLIVEAFLDLDENDERQGSQLAARTRLESRPSISVVLLLEDSSQLSTIHGADARDPRDVMFACVRITPPYLLWEALLEREPLPTWRHHGSLARLRPLVLTKGQTEVAEYKIHYDEKRGLEWRKIDAHI